jgi:hypothetical protein
MSFVAVLFCLAGFVALVVLLAARNAHRTDGRACCAPADPRQDLRMRAADDEQVGRTKHP